MTADGVDAPITEDTETSEPAKDQHRYAFLSRHISMLRALRLSGILTILRNCIVTYFWAAATTLFGHPKDCSSGLFLGILLIFITWAWSRQINGFGGA